MSFHIFHINEVYSNADGTVQFIEFVGEADGQHLWAGHSLTSTHGVTTNTYNFPTNLASSLTAGKSVLVATQGFADLGLVTPDYIIPDGFLFTNGGTVNFPGMDSLTYAVLPTDGTHSLNGNGAIVVNSPANFAGDSVMPGTSGPDSLDGGAGKDIMSGDAGNDTLNGGLGDDTLIGGLGDDSMDGGDGVDTVSYASASAGIEVRLFSLAQDNSSAGLGIDTLTNIENLIGSDFGDTLLGTGSSNNHLSGGAGNDLMGGGGGTDTTVGGTGNDTHVVNDAGDVLIENTNEGVDTVNVQRDGTYTLGANFENAELGGFINAGIIGNNLDNSIFESNATLSGNNIFNGGTGNDTMSYKFANGAVTVSLAQQGAQQDTMGEGNDTLSGFENLTGSDFGDILTGDGAANKLKGEIGSDTIVGGSGNDTLDGGSGDDQLNGDIGLDMVAYISAGSAVTVNLGNLTAQNTGGAGTDTLIAIENLTGSNFADTLTGNSSANVLNGGTGTDTASYANAAAGVTVSLATTVAQNTVAMGSDTLISIENLTGSNFADTLTGNSSANVLNGGTGTDTASYANAAAGVTVSLATTVAQNTVAMGSDTLTNIENLTGSNFADTLTGNSGNNTLNGGAGVDILTGGLGDDLYIVNAVTDDTVEALAAGTDSVQSSTHYGLRANVEHLMLTGSGPINGTGNALNNTLTGTSGNNSLNGSTGSDTASYANAAAGVTVSLATTVAQNTVAMGSDTLTNIENLTGSNFNDTLTGNSGNNTLDGGAGVDILTGGLGDDLYIVNAGTDDAVEALAAGTDTVQSSTHYGLRANVEHLMLTGSGPINGTGNALNNTLTGTSGNNSLNGSTGSDTASYANAAAGVTVSLATTVAQNTVAMGSDTLTNIENLTGSNFADTLTGNTGSNLLTGSAGNDTLNGGEGNDTLIGGAGKDSLTGGLGNDIFDYNVLTESGITNTTWDVINFAVGDKIDLLTLDANAATTANDAFTFIGGASFSAVGQVRYAGGVLYGSNDADTTAEFAMQLVGSPALAASDLIL